MICETYHEIICYLADLFIIIKGERGSLELFLGKEVAINTLQSRGQSFTSLMAVFCQDINSVVFRILIEGVLMEYFLEVIVSTIIHCIIKIFHYGTY